MIHYTPSGTYNISNDGFNKVNWYLNKKVPSLIFDLCKVSPRGTYIKQPKELNRQACDILP